MESGSALVCGEYSSGDEESELHARNKQSDVNYDEVGMDMGSSCSSEQEDAEARDHSPIKKTHHSVDTSLFSSKEEYEAYQNQFNSRPHQKRKNTQGHQHSGERKTLQGPVDECDGNIASEYGGVTDQKVDKNTHSKYAGDNDNENNEYGGWQPNCQKTKPKKQFSLETSPLSREPHRRGTNSKESNEVDNFISMDEIKATQLQNRPSFNEEKLKDKLLSLSQEEPSSSGSELGGHRAQHPPSGRSRSKEKSRRSRSPKSTSKKRSRSRSKSRERRDHDHHRSSHHRSSKHHRHHHRDHRERERDRHDRDRGRNFRGNDGRRSRDRVAEEHRQEMRNKKLVNLGITSDAVLAVASQAGSSGGIAIRAQEMINKQLEAQVAKAKEVTGVQLPSYYNPSVINPLKYADQIKKRKMLWGTSGGGTGVRQMPQVDNGSEVLASDAQQANSHEEAMNARKSIFENSTKKPEKESFNKWETTNLGDNKANDKFRRLMGIKSATSSTAADGGNSQPSTKAVGDKSSMFFQEQEAQYEKARAITHTQRGLGLGFSGNFQQTEHSSTGQPPHGSLPEKSNSVEISNASSNRGIGERLGFVKKSV